MPAHKPLPLERLFDNRAVSDDTRPGDADFDGAGASLSAQDLRAAGWTPGRDIALDAAILPAYDSGDHLHPGDAGLRAMAESIDLRKLLG
ncbi:hypothetical protein [Streptomyces rhizosphaericus]|uniref:hypothetical protein n=1 Tax=Streptomyces rhizosphaericus TaxID=114699 RepID=UPI0035D4035C